MFRAENDRQQACREEKQAMRGCRLRRAEHIMVARRLARPAGYPCPQTATAHRQAALVPRAVRGLGPAATKACFHDETVGHQPLDVDEGGWAARPEEPARRYVIPERIRGSEAVVERAASRQPGRVHRWTTGITGWSQRSSSGSLVGWAATRSVSLATVSKTVAIKTPEAKTQFKSPSSSYTYPWEALGGNFGDLTRIRLESGYLSRHCSTALPCLMK